MAERDELIAKLARYCLEGRLCFLTGAGIDMGRRSYVPGWNEILSSLLESIGRGASVENINYIDAYRDLLLNEVILQKIDNILSLATGNDEAGEVIRICTDTNEYSPIHRFLAWCIDEFGNSVLTTNYNLLIEYAAGELVEKKGAALKNLDRLVKLHGSLDYIKNMRYKIDSVYAPLSKNIVEKAAPLLENHLLLVAGYRGADEFDIIPLIFERHKPDDIIWIVHPSSEPEKQIDDLAVQRLHQYYGQEPIVMDIDQLLENVYQQVASTSDKRDSKLDQAWASFNDKKKANWWKPRIRRWADTLWRHHSDDMHFLWANIAEHVRASFADEAYKKSIAGADIMQQLYAKAHIAYLDRTVNKRDLNKFREVIGEIQNKIYIESNPTLIKSLRDLLAWTLHQYGIACQNENHYYEAKIVLEEALRERISTGDYQVSNTIFQLFMNGYQANKVEHYQIDDFAPMGWRRWLDIELQRYEGIFRENNYAEQHSLIVHNRAMIHQAIAEEHKQQEENHKALNEYELALKLNNEAYKVRRRLRDPRMIAQSLTRICQCKLGIITIDLSQGEKTKYKYEEIERHIRDIQDIYDHIPQEDNRKQDLKKLKEDLKALEENRVALGWE